jgi:hypothetical protein
VGEILKSSNYKVRIALVQYTDHCSTMVTKSNGFTDSVSEMKDWLDVCYVSGGSLLNV